MVAILGVYMSQDEDMFYDNQLDLKLFTVLTSVRPSFIDEDIEEEQEYV